jgi:hypothetical protein
LSNIISRTKETDSIMSYASGRTVAEDCSRIKDLGYGIARHVHQYGQRFQIVSDPFPDGVGVAVHAITANDSARRTLRLPVSILLGLKDLLSR